MATGVRDIRLGFQGSPPDGGLIAGTHGVMPQGISTWGKLASSAGPCAEETVAQFIKVARNEVENASFAQRSAHRDSRIWRPELIEPAAERNRRARGRRPTFKSAFPDPQILPQCKISSNYPL